MITKILVDRLGILCSKIILCNQFGFDKGCASRDCVVGTSECFNCLEKGNYGGNFALKIDIRKGFDSIS